MSKIISFSVFGDHPIYITGAVENARLYRKIFPGWKCRFYVSDEISDEIIEQLREYGADVTIKKRLHAFDGLFWRFFPAAEKTLDAMIVRDTDSRPSNRERMVVDEWIESGRPLHIIRDHPNHIAPIMGGMWGCRGHFLGDIRQKIGSWLKMHSDDKYGRYEEKNSDQVFLNEMVYSELSKQALIHSEFVRFQGERARPIYAPRQDGEFIGQIFDESGATREDHVSELQRALRRGRNRFTLRQFNGNSDAS